MPECAANIPVKDIQLPLSLAFHSIHHVWGEAGEVGLQCFCPLLSGQFQSSLLGEESLPLGNPNVVSTTIEGCHRWPWG